MTSCCVCESEAQHCEIPHHGSRMMDNFTMDNKVTIDNTIIRQRTEVDGPVMQVLASYQSKSLHTE